jgi:hypothetical protein
MDECTEWKLLLEDLTTLLGDADIPGLRIVLASRSEGTIRLGMEQLVLTPGTYATRTLAWTS